MTGKIIKIIGFTATIMGVGASLVTDWVNEKKMDERIDEKVREALSTKDSETEES